MELRVADNPDKSRYEIEVDGEIAGFVDYLLGVHNGHNGQDQDDIAFLHTETDDRFRGKGIASHLIQATLDSARERKLAVLPFCPFVRAWIGEHRDYVDLVPADRRSDFAL
jgi:predicted GNAT family acetyltransferase